MRQLERKLPAWKIREGGGKKEKGENVHLILLPRAQWHLAKQRPPDFSNATRVTSHTLSFADIFSSSLIAFYPSHRRLGLDPSQRYPTRYPIAHVRSRAIRGDVNDRIPLNDKICSRRSRFTRLRESSVILVDRSREYLRFTHCSCNDSVPRNVVKISSNLNGERRQGKSHQSVVEIDNSDQSRSKS